MADRIQLRRDSAANWALVNPVLAEGEVGWETDTRRMKVGDGSSPWSTLTYVGGDDAHYAHEQAVASDTWTINHGLGKYPSVTIVDSAGDEVEGNVNHVGLNQTVVSFSAAFSGRAFLN